MTQRQAGRTGRGRGVQGERRTVTVLFCDVAGSTAMAEKLDPEDWAEIMNSAFEYLTAPVERYEGKVARLMGDAILAFFGAPVAHEDDPQRAILAGLDIVESIGKFREEIKREYGLDFNMRIGINTGPVVVGEVGSDSAGEYTRWATRSTWPRGWSRRQSLAPCRWRTIPMRWWSRCSSSSP